RTKPQFAIDKRVKVWALVDQREGIEKDSLARKVWRRARGKIVPAGEFAAGYCTERVERAVIEYVAELNDGILVTTRPALNLISARRAGSGVIRVAQDHMNLGSYRKPVRDQIARHYGQFDAVVVLTETSRAEYRQVLPGTPIIRIPNGIPMAGRAHSDHSAPVIIAVGRLVKQKGFDYLIQAFASIADRHPEWELRVFGTGPLEDKLRDLIEEHGLTG